MNNINIYCVVTFFVIFLIYFFVLPYAAKKLLFRPTIVSDSEFEKFCEKYKTNVKSVSFIPNGGTKISAILVNRINEPNVNDNLIFYCHGNSLCIGELYCSNAVKTLSNLKNATTFMFDYRGYGNSEGEISEDGLYIDTLHAWDYVTKTLGVPENKIILYGRSLGGSIASNLLLHLLKNNRKLPKVMFLDSTFKTLPSAVDKLTFMLGHLITHTFNNIHNLKKIKKLLKTKNNNVPIYLLHSKDDEIIKYIEAVELSNETGYKLIDIFGLHGHPIYPKNVIKLFKSSIQNNQ